MKKLNFTKLHYLMLALLLPLAVYAADVAQIGDTKYESIVDAIAAVQDGTPTTITMIADEDIDIAATPIVIPAGKNISLDLNGKTITGACASGKTSAMFTNHGDFTIMDSSNKTSGKLVYNPNPTWTYSTADPGGYASNLIRNEGVLTIESGSLYNSGTGSAAYAIDNYYAGMATVNGGTIDAAKASAIRLFYNNGGALNVNGGVIGHYNDDNDASYMGVQVMGYGTNGVNVSVTGGEVNGAYALYVGNGNDWSKSRFNISGGIFNSYVCFTATVTGEQASITGGVFNAWTGSYADNGQKIISGGTYAEEPEPGDIVNGYYAADNLDGTWTVTACAAKIGDKMYATLADAAEAAMDGETITLLKDCAGNGIKVPQGKYTTGLTVDFNGFTYTVDGDLVGSTGTETQAFQLLKDNKVTFMNGTIYSEKTKILVQNYSDLTLRGMTLTMANDAYAYGYTLSNNNGNIVIDNSVINANTGGGFAFDVCRYSSYPSVNVKVQNGSVINGNVEVSASGSNPRDGFSLTLEGGTLNGDIVLDASAAAVIESTPEKAVITKADSFEQAAPEGYKWQSNNDGTGTLVIDEEDPEEGDTTGVNDAASESINEIVGYYMLNGVKVSKSNKGIYIVKYANGKAKKVIF